LERVNTIAGWYYEMLTGTGLILPVVIEEFTSSWAQYTIQLPESSDRGRIQEVLKEAGIPTMVYYKKPMHRQRAFKGTTGEKAVCPNTNELCESVLCLPIHPYLERAEVEMVCEKLVECL